MWYEVKRVKRVILGYIEGATKEIMENNEIEQKKQLQVTGPKKRILNNRNWLFVKFYLESEGDALYAYQRAGYKGKSLSAPYEMVHSLKQEINIIAEEKGMNRVSMLIKTKRLIDKPLGRVNKYGKTQELTHLTPIEHLKALEFAKKLTDKAKEERKEFSPVTIVTGKEGKTQVNFNGPQDKHKLNKDNGKIEQSEDEGKS